MEDFEMATRILDDRDLPDNPADDGEVLDFEPLTREQLDEILSSPDYADYCDDEHDRAMADEYREAEHAQRFGNDHDLGGEG